MAIKSITPINEEFDEVVLDNLNHTIIIDKTNLKYAYCFNDTSLTIDLLKYRRDNNLGYTLNQLNNHKISTQDLKTLQKTYGVS
jgi:hypothetical protein